jgi:hypothetical protein
VKERNKERKRFFFEKKNQKTFIHGSLDGRRQNSHADQPGGGPSMAFCTKPMPRMT